MITRARGAFWGCGFRETPRSRCGLNGRGVNRHGRLGSPRKGQCPGRQQRGRDSNRLGVHEFQFNLASSAFGSAQTYGYSMSSPSSCGRTFEHMIRSEQERQRIASVDALRARGIDPYPAAAFPVTHHCVSLKSNSKKGLRSNCQDASCPAESWARPPLPNCRITRGPFRFTSTEMNCALATTNRCTMTCSRSSWTAGISLGLKARRSRPKSGNLLSR